jgi:hypothetical protein
MAWRNSQAATLACRSLPDSARKQTRGIISKSGVNTTERSASRTRRQKNKLSRFTTKNNAATTAFCGKMVCESRGRMSGGWYQDGKKKKPYNLVKTKKNKTYCPWWSVKEFIRFQKNVITLLCNLGKNGRMEKRRKENVERLFKKKKKTTEQPN